MDEFADIIAQLESKCVAIDKALEALRDIEGAPAVAPKKRGRPPGTKNLTVVKPAAAKKGGLSEQGRQSLSKNMRKRWALKRAAAKKAIRKAAST